MILAVCYLEQARFIYANLNIEFDSVLLGNCILAYCFFMQGLSTFDPYKAIELLALRQKGSSARKILLRVEPALQLLQPLVLSASEGHLYSNSLLQAYQHVTDLLGHVVSVGQDLDSRLERTSPSQNSPSASL